MTSKIDDSILAFHQDMIAWRRDLHAHPETAFEEVRSAGIVAEKLESFGLQVHRGLAKTGVVASLTGKRAPVQGQTPRAVGLRADMDALHLHEANSFDHKSRHEGKMHACGHDGHTVMLLGAARALAENPDFCGQVHFIFQPAEENEGGGRVMVEEGLFDLFPVDLVFGMHNWPGLEQGRFAIRPGPVMASADRFQITVRGVGAHAAMPDLGSDAVLGASAIVQGLQAIVSRNIHPQDPAVVSVTKIHGGDTWNVIPAEVVLGGTMRSFTPEVQAFVEQRIREVADSVARAWGCEAETEIWRGYPATINDPEAAALARKVVTELVGTDQVETARKPSMGAEDFAFLLQARPGAYIWIGNGPGTGGCMLHNPNYDFNDDILPLGAQYWVNIARAALAA